MSTKQTSACHEVGSGPCAESMPSVASDATQTIAEREVAVVASEDMVLDREKDAAAEEEIVLGREKLVESREAANDLREESADLREDVATLRETAMRAQEDIARTTAVHHAGVKAQLQEANDRLAAASADIQTMAETAELAAAQVAHMGGHDFLTGLPNRSLLSRRLAQSIEFAQHHSKKVALMLLGLDHFKHINDSLGHMVGDQLLQSVARRLQACVRSSDTVSRQGATSSPFCCPKSSRRRTLCAWPKSCSRPWLTRT